MLANANVPSFGGWLPDPQYSSLLYSPASDQSGIFDTAVGQKSQQQLQQMVVQHAKNESSTLDLSSSFISDGTLGIGPCPSHVQPPLVPSHAPFHPSTAPCPNQLANFVQNAFCIQTAMTGGGGPAMTSMLNGSADGAHSTGDRPRISFKKKPRPVPEDKKDQAYRERRRKNNDSARRSREQRRRKEEETQQRNTELEKENAQLRRELQYARLEINNYRLFLEMSKQNQIA